MSATPENGYVYMLDSNKVVYLPTCLLFHMITNCFTQMSIVNMAGSVVALVSDIPTLISRLADNFLATARASEQNRVMHFPGDWKSDRVRMRNLLNSVISCLGYMGEIVGQADRRKLSGSAERLTQAWGLLARILDGKTVQEMQAATKLPCVSYFRSVNLDTWKQTMALTLLSLDEEVSGKGIGRRLILLCHRRVRTALLKEIEDIERKQHAQTLFSPDKILCVYNDDLPVTCPNCAKMTAVDNTFTRQTVRKCYLREAPGKAGKAAARPDAAALDVLTIPASLRDDGV